MESKHQIYINIIQRNKMLSLNHCTPSYGIAERLRHCSREQRVPSSSPAWTSVLR